MNTYRNHGYLHTPYHQLQTYRIPRFSIEQPLCKMNTFLFEEGIGEHTCLQKYANQNYKIINSTSFDEQQPQMQKQVDVMKFSFNQNFTDQILTKTTQKSNQQVKNDGQPKKVNCTLKSGRMDKQAMKQKGEQGVMQNLVGSIKRNRTYENQQKCRLTSTFDHEAEIDDPLKLQQMGNKFRKMLKPKPSVLSSDYLNYSAVNSWTNRFDHHPSEKNLNQYQEKAWNTSNDPNWVNRCLRSLFNRLDKNQIGTLSDTNCWIDGLKEEIKFIFGTIFSRIKLKDQQFTLQQFQQEAQIILQSFNRQQYQWIFNDFWHTTGLNKCRQDRSSKNIYNVSTKKIKSDDQFAEDQVDSAQVISKRPYINLEQTYIQPGGTGIRQQNKQFMRSQLSRISREVITEHKKNLEDLDRLNSMMESYLENQKVPIFGGYEKERGRLRFEQCVKHI